MLYIYSTFIYTYYHIFAIYHNTLYLIYVNNIEQLYVVCIYIYQVSLCITYLIHFRGIHIHAFCPVLLRHHTAVHLGPPQVPKMPLSTLQPWHSVEGYSVLSCGKNTRKSGCMVTIFMVIVGYLWISYICGIITIFIHIYKVVFAAQAERKMLHFEM